MTIFLCEDHLDGIFTAIYDAYASKLGHSQIKIKIQDACNYELFTDYVTVITDPIKAEKVSKTVYRRLGAENYQTIIEASYAIAEDKAEAIYKTIVIGLGIQDGKKVLNNLANDYVRRVAELGKMVWHETHRFMGFVRFKELESGILYSAIHPKANVLPLIANHFSDRYRNENWMIHDEGRNIFLVHEAMHQWVLAEGVNIDLEMLRKVSPKEQEYEKLWKEFCNSVSIKERESYRRQRQVLPLKFRNNMVEFYKNEG